MRVDRRRALCFAVLVSLIGSGVDARGETISGALATAYRTNPDLNQQRAATRAADEGVAKAKSGYRPRIEGFGELGYSTTDALHGDAVDTKSGSAVQSNARIVARQMLFDAGRTRSRVEAAESRVLQSRETSRQKEQEILLSTATAYMDVLRDTALLDLRKNDVELLIYRLREARARYRVSEVTATDVAEVAAFLATARSDFFRQQAVLFQSIAVYRRLVGHAPKRLEAARPIDGLLPSSLPAAISLALAEHPRVQASLHAVDAAEDDLHLAEAQLYPDITARNRTGQYNADHGNRNRNFFVEEATTDVTVPIYQGGAEYAAVRTAKEHLTQLRLQTDAARDLVRAGVMSSWGQLEATKVLVHSSEVAVRSAETAFIGVREEARVGQRTTYDLLRAIQSLLQARVTLIGAQRDRVVASYAVLAATGRLSTVTLSLPVEPYDPTVHYVQVKDKWIGLRTPDGQ